MDYDFQADKDFTRARRKAFLRRIGAFLRRDPGSNRLLSFEEVKSALGALEQVYLGMRTVPVKKIVGSVGRHRDFDRAFLPSKGDLETRWKRIDQMMHRAEELPPISLYKIGDAYFVRDGNHRVSVARQLGGEMIDAEVIELRSRVPIDSALTARDLLHKIEQRHLLERLPIDRVLPEVRVELSDVTDYRRLDRKSTRLNSSHSNISYAVFCLKKKDRPDTQHHRRDTSLVFDHPLLLLWTAGAHEEYACSRRRDFARKRRIFLRGERPERRRDRALLPFFFKRFLHHTHTLFPPPGRSPV